jgi:hypothetical protein
VLLVQLSNPVLKRSGNADLSDSGIFDVETWGINEFPKKNFGLRTGRE